MQGCAVVEPEVSKSYSFADWREDAKALLMRAGVEGKSLVLLLAEDKIVHEVRLSVVPVSAHRYHLCCSLCWKT
jgi:hypothetical protein